MKTICTKATSQSHAGMNLATARDTKTKSLYEELGGTYTLGEDGMYYPDLEIPKDEEPRSRMLSTSGEFVEILCFREGNEESSEEARAEKARVYADSTTARDLRISSKFSDSGTLRDI